MSLPGGALRVGQITLGGRNRFRGTPAGVRHVLDRVPQLLLSVLHIPGRPGTGFRHALFGVRQSSLRVFDSAGGLRPGLGGVDLGVPYTLLCLG